MIYTVFLFWTFVENMFRLFKLNKLWYILPKEVILLQKIDLLQEYKELYEHEIAFNDRLNAKISNSLAILTIVGTGEGIVWKDCFNMKFNIIFFILCFVSLQCFVIALYKFYKAYTNYKYGYYPVDLIKDYVDKTYRIVKDKNKDINIADNHIIKGFQDNYIKCAIINRKQNTLKSNAHRKLSKWIIISIISIFVCYACDIIISSNMLGKLL